jgi:hypothetical protein
LEAAAIADIEAFAALQATIDPAANFFNQLVGVNGVEVDVDLVPVQVCSSLLLVYQMSPC